jgi:hypothetical protein
MIVIMTMTKVMIRTAMEMPITTRGKVQLLSSDFFFCKHKDE